MGTPRRKQSVAPFLRYTLLSAALFLNTTPLCAEEEAETSTPPALTWRESWRGVDEAMRLYQEGQYEEAAALFGAIRNQAPEGEFDLDALRLMEGTAYWNAGNPEAAKTALEAYEDLASDTHKMQKRQVLGSANLSLARKQWEEAQGGSAPEALESAKQSAQEAVSAFKSGLSIDPGDADTLTQLEKAHRLLKDIEEMQQQQQEQQEDQQQEDQDDNQEQEQQDQQDSQEESEHQDQQERQDESEEEQDSQKDSSDDSQDSEEEPQEQEDNASSQQEEDQEDASQDPQNQNSPGQEQEQPQDLSEQQAQQLLDTYDEQERRQRRQFLQQRAQAIPVEKDW